MEVSFNEERFERPLQTGIRSAHPGGIAGWLIRTGIVRTEAAANWTMLATIALSVAIIIFFWVRSGPAPVTQEQKRLQAWMAEGHVGKPPPSFMPGTRP